MGAPIKRVESWTASDYDMIIDVRSPAEFADDHLPGAVNLPVLDDDERAEIGTMYKKISPFAAKRAGAALIAGNIARHIGSALKDTDRNFRPLVYCWRGGQRSDAMARVFSEIGWQTDLVENGYKRYRKQVLDGLDSLPQHFNFVVLRGRTGLAKTHILQAALTKGAQVINLEALANHRGSLLGPEPNGDQPPQRLFESNLYAVLRNLNASVLSLSRQKVIKLARFISQRRSGQPCGGRFRLWLTRRSNIGWPSCAGITRISLLSRRA